MVGASPLSASATSSIVLQAEHNNINSISGNNHDMNTTNDNDIAQLPVVRANVRNHVHSLVVHSVPLTQSQAYLQAMTVDSQLVLTESDPIQFVRICRYDVWAAALRLCLYWTERVRLFGLERAFLPLTLMGTGAMSVQDIQALQIGCLAILPDTFCRQKCVLWDRRNSIPVIVTTMESKLRAWFYVFSLLARDDRTQTEPIMLMIYSSAGPTSLEQAKDWEFISQMSCFVTRTFPVQLRLHLLSIPQLQSPQQLQDQTVSSEPVWTAVSAFVVFHQCISLQIPIQMHEETESNRILMDLLSLGMNPKGIPSFVGGEWTLEDWNLWLQDRRKGEREEYHDRIVALASSSGLCLPQGLA